MREKVRETVGYSYPIYQYVKGYRYSVDALLLAAFLKDYAPGKNIYEIGIGSGVITLLLGKRFPHHRYGGIEIQEDLYHLAKENFKLNGLEVALELGDVRKKADRDVYDIILSNPPFYLTDEGMKSPLEEVAVARHEIECRLADVISYSRKALKRGGDLYLIYPTSRLTDVLSEMREGGIAPYTLKFIHPRKDKDANLFLIMGRKGYKGKAAVGSPFILYDEEGNYSEMANRMFKEGVIPW